MFTICSQFGHMRFIIKLYDGIIKNDYMIFNHNQSLNHIQYDNNIITINYDINGGKYHE